MNILGNIIVLIVRFVVYSLFAVMVISPFYLIWALTDFDVYQKSFSSLFFVIIDLIVFAIFFKNRK